MVVDRSCVERFELLAVTLSGRGDGLLNHFISALADGPADDVVSEIKSSVLRASLMARGERDRYFDECVLPTLRQNAKRTGSEVAGQFALALSDSDGHSSMDLMQAMGLMEMALARGYSAVAHRVCCSDDGLHYPLTASVKALLGIRAFLH